MVSPEGRKDLEHSLIYAKSGKESVPYLSELNTEL